MAQHSSYHPDVPSSPVPSSTSNVYGEPQVFPVNPDSVMALIFPKSTPTTSIPLGSPLGGPTSTTVLIAESPAVKLHGESIYHRMSEHYRSQAQAQAQALEMQMLKSSVTGKYCGTSLVEPPSLLQGVTPVSTDLTCTPEVHEMLATLVTLTTHGVITWQRIEIWDGHKNRTTGYSCTSNGVTIKARSGSIEIEGGGSYPLTPRESSELLSVVSDTRSPWHRFLGTPRWDTHGGVDESGCLPPPPPVG